jgi:anti-sigma-K factor RskA
LNLDDPQDRSVAAGEYVLGTLDDAARAALERRLGGDTALQGEVYAWQDRLIGLIRGVAPAEPKPQLWPDIEAGLAVAGSGPALPRAVPSDTTGSAANDPLWRRLRRWQIAGGLAMAAVLVLASLLVLRPPPVPAERYLAVLQAPDSNAAGWIVEATSGGSVRLVPVGPAEPVPPGKALQFWTKGEREAGPTSLGLVEPGKVTELPADRLPVLEPRQLFELTLEPEAGSPIGRPTGPILFVGKTVRL